MVKDSIILTVYNRESAVLLSTMRWLAMQDLTDTEIIVVDDVSTADYSFLDELQRVITLRRIKIEPYECYNIQGYKNPAKAFNTGLAAATGERVAILSSDVILPPDTLEAARSSYDGTFLYSPMVIDLGSFMEYCGPHRVFPMPWFLYGPRQAMLDAGGWEELLAAG